MGKIWVWPISGQKNKLGLSLRNKRRVFGRKIGGEIFWEKNKPGLKRVLGANGGKIWVLGRKKKYWLELIFEEKKLFGPKIGENMES